MSAIDNTSSHVLDLPERIHTRAHLLESSPNLHASTSTGQPPPCLFHMSTPEAHEQAGLACPLAACPPAILVRWLHLHRSRAYPLVVGRRSKEPEIPLGAPKTQKNETVAENYPHSLFSRKEKIYQLFVETLCYDEGRRHSKLKRPSAGEAKVSAGGKLRFGE